MQSIIDTRYRRRLTRGNIYAITTKATPASPAETVVSGVSHVPFGPMAALVYGNGLNLIRSWDQNYWLSRVRVNTGSVMPLYLTLSRDANGAPQTNTDNTGGARGASYTYTDAGRLATASGPWGNLSFQYDAAGNRIQKVGVVSGATTTENAVPKATSNRLDRVTDAAGAAVRTFTYRGDGALVQDVRAGGSTYGYLYSARERLAGVTKDGAQIGAYSYDFRGDLVRRLVSGQDYRYVRDPQGHILAVYLGAALQREYVWLDDLPVAVIDRASGTPKTYYIATGFVDEPLLMTDAARATVWAAALDPYGTAQFLGTPGAALDLRLPGQWLQAETGGLHQNGRRDYDPSLGRYIQPDPLGIEAGQNLYAYVDGRPTEWVDPSGTALCPPGMPSCRVQAPELGGGATPIPRTMDYGPNALCRPAGVPENWLMKPTKKAAVSDTNPHNQVRQMPGNPTSPNPAQQQQYVKEHVAGQAIDRNGRPVPSDSPEAHIPAEIYRYRGHVVSDE